MPTTTPPNISFLAAAGAWEDNPSRWPTLGNIVSTNGNMQAVLGAPTTSPHEADLETWSFMAQLPMTFAAKIALQRKHNNDQDPSDPRPKTWYIYVQHEENIAHGVSADVLAEQFRGWVLAQLNRVAKQGGGPVGKQSFRAILEERLSVQDKHLQELCEKGKRALDRKDLEGAMQITLDALKARTAREAIAQQLATYDDMQKGRP